MEKITKEQKDLKEYFDTLIHKNGNFNWVNDLYKNTSQTSIDLDNPKLNKNDNKILSEFLDKIENENFKENHNNLNFDKNKNNNNKSTDKKFMRNKTVNSKKKCKLGLLIEYELENSKLLNKNFKFENNLTIGHLYRVEVNSKKSSHNNSLKESKSIININEMKYNFDLNIENSKRSFAILSPSPITNLIKFKIFNSEENCEENVQINFIKKLKINRIMIEKMVLFHHRLFSDLFGYKDLENPELNRLEDEESDERKYLIIPIRKEDSIKWKVDDATIEKVVQYNTKKIIGKSMKSIIEDELNKVNESVGISLLQAKHTIESKIKKRIFYSNYKHLPYDVEDLFFADDSSEYFIEKLANLNINKSKILDSNLEEIKLMIKSKYFNTIADEEFYNLTVKDLIVNMPTQSESINGFRKIGVLNNLDINYNEVGFAIGSAIKSIKSFDYSYNKQLTIKNKKKKFEVSIHSILPIEFLNNYFIRKDEYQLACRLPTILLNLERKILAADIISIYFNEYLIENKVTNSDLENIIMATTSVGVNKNYNFETLETLGDSIIKIILSIILYYFYPLETEGFLQGKRRDLLKNDKLQEIGIKSQIYKFINSQPLKVSSWEPPLIRKLIMKYEQSITKKSIADVVESLVGCGYMMTKTFSICYSFMKKVGIFSQEILIDEKILNEKLFLNDDLEYHKWNDSELIENFSFYKDISFVDLFLFDKNNKNFKVNFPFSNPVPNKKSLNDLQDRINYKFSNSYLLIAALTHQSVTKDLEKNYQRLELLGDAVLEVYLMVRLFQIFEDKLYKFNEVSFIDNFNKKEEVFNCGNLSHAKSLLASNNFLIKISVLLNLHEFISITDKHSIDNIESFFDESNIEIILTTKINQYESDPTNCIKPKILSDVFESLLGAIMIDSNINKCFEFLDEVYTPFLLYITANFNDIKYSPISEFIEVVQKKLNICPRFSKVELSNKMIEVTAWAEDSEISKGTALNEDRAKEIAAIEGMNKLK